MESLREEILNKSSDIIKQLSEYVSFFEEPILMKIYLQTQIIHKLFEDNEDIDISKLELYHLQFSSTLLTLLEKIKLKNERIVRMYENEIAVNNEMIEKLRKIIQEEGGFDLDKEKQAERMSRTLRRIYTSFYENKEDYPFTEDVTSFSIKYYKDHFFDIPNDIFRALTEYDRTKIRTFKNKYVAIEQYLLRDLGSVNFKIKYFVGVKSYPMLLEVYEFKDKTNEYFLYWPAKNLFLKCDISLLPYEKWEAEMSKRPRMIKELTRNNQKAEQNIKNTERYISHDIIDLLGENYDKITDIDFLASLEDINIHAEILKSMLDTKMI